MGRYIPPALRKKQQDASSQLPGAPEQTTASPNDDNNLRSLASLSISDNAKKQNDTLHYTLDEVHEHFRPPSAVMDPTVQFRPCPPSSLNNSLDLPLALAYVMLFPGANPRWSDENVVFAKSNLELLPGLHGLVTRCWTDGRGLRKSHKGQVLERGDHWRVESAHEQAQRVTPEVTAPNSAASDLSQPSSDSSSQAHPLVDYISDDDIETTTAPPDEDLKPTDVSSRLIPVFQQTRRGWRTVEFLGYYQLQKITYVRPHSRALVRMLETKFTGNVTPSQTGPKTGRNPRLAEEELQANAGAVELNVSADGPTAEGTIEPAASSISQGKGRRKGRNDNAEGPAQRSGEAWSKSLSVPWAKIKLIAPPKGRAKDVASDFIQAKEERSKEHDFWSTDETVMPPPKIETHPENDGDHFKESRDSFKQRHERGRGRGAYRGGYGYGARGSVNPGQFGGNDLRLESGVREPDATRANVIEGDGI